MMLSLFFVTFFRLKSLQVSEREGGSLIYNNIIIIVNNKLYFASIFQGTSKTSQCNWKTIHNSAEERN